MIIVITVLHLSNGDSSLAIELPYSKNFIDIGELNSLEIPYMEDVYISRNYGLSEALTKENNRISKSGTYIVNFKKYNKIIGFKIPYEEKFIITNREELSDMIYLALLERRSNLKLKISDEYATKDDFKKQQLSNILNEILYKNPLIMYSGCSYSYDGTFLEFTFHNDSNMTDDDILKSITVIENGIRDYVNSLNLKLHDIEIEKKVVYDLLNYIEYDTYSAEVERQSSSSYIQGLMDGDNKITCAGYARLFMLIMNFVGIPTSIIRGNTIIGEHAWNIINYDNDNYHVDLTWSDSYDAIDSSYIPYINEKDNFMKLTHDWEYGKYPVCNGSKYNNRYIYDLVTFDNFLNANEVKFPLNIIINKNEHYNFAKKIANKLNSKIKYFTIDKIGYSIVKVIKVN